MREEIEPLHKPMALVYLRALFPLYMKDATPPMCVGQCVRGQAAGRYSGMGSGACSLYIGAQMAIAMCLRALRSRPPD